MLQVGIMSGAVMRLGICEQKVEMSKAPAGRRGMDWEIQKKKVIRKGYLRI